MALFSLGIITHRDTQRSRDGQKQTPINTETERYKREFQRRISIHATKPKVQCFSCVICFSFSDVVCHTGAPEPWDLVLPCFDTVLLHLLLASGAGDDDAVYYGVVCFIAFMGARKCHQWECKAVVRAQQRRYLQFCSWTIFMFMCMRAGFCVALSGATQNVFLDS